jgi:hypothetical protein
MTEGQIDHRKQIEEGVWIGGLRVIGLAENEDRSGTVTLRPDNEMVGRLTWAVKADLFSRMRIGTRIQMQANGDLFDPD